MIEEPISTQRSPGAYWLGWVLGGLPSLLLIFSGVMKILQPADMMKEVAKMELPANTILPIGVVELACVVLYLIPQTAMLGAILLTGYMGGAILTHVRLGEPFYIQVIIGVVLWVGLYLREPRLRALLPVRSVN